MTLSNNHGRAKLFYFCAASLFLFFFISRAISLNIQGDEVGTYFRARAGLGPILRLEDPNNHFLNTILIYITTLRAEYSEIAIRLPSLAVYAWFIFLYIPGARCFKGWEGKLLFLSFIGLSFYFGEYVSMARGYAMSGCFAAAAFSEMLTTTPSELSYSLRDSIRGLRLTVFAILSVLASLSVAPLSACILLYKILERRRIRLKPVDLNVRALKSRVIYTIGLVVIVIFAGTSYLQIKASNIAIPASPCFV